MAYVMKLVLVWILSFGGEVVELEPVKADLQFNCNRLTDINKCQASPFCYWGSGSTCVNDPCLIKSGRTLQGTSDTCENANSGDVTCAAWTNSNLKGHDCYLGPAYDTGTICSSTQVSPSSKAWDYCAYAFIRDQKCPQSICTEATTTDTTNTDKVGCIKNTQTRCTMLSEDECKWVPKCYYSSGQCLIDPCWQGSTSKDCSKYTGFYENLTAGDCVDFKPLKNQSTDIVGYCLSKNNKNPNICYFAGENASNSVDDYLETYPTYDYGSNNPECTNKYGDCEGTGDCYTTFNQVGALAGRYCTDGEHGSANVVRIPSVLVFLILSALSIVSIFTK